MDAETRTLAGDLRRQSSGEIADWLINRYPLVSINWGKALLLLDHLSVEKQDARRLANHYLSQLPYASDHVYRIFTKLLGPDELVKIIRDFVPSEQKRRDLLRYHLSPILRGAARSSEHEQALWRSLIPD